MAIFSAFPADATFIRCHIGARVVLCRWQVAERAMPATDARRRLQGLPYRIHFTMEGRASPLAVVSAAAAGGGGGAGVGGWVGGLAIEGQMWGRGDACFSVRPPPGACEKVEGVDRLERVTA